MSEAVITLHGLTKRFAGMDKPAVAPLDCTIHSGYVTGLVGPDGAGKTTLMRMLAGLLKADGGNASVLGFDPIQNDSELHAVLAICRRNSVCMKILPSWRTLISMPIYAALPARYGKRPLPVCWSLPPSALSLAVWQENCPAG